MSAFFSANGLLKIAISFYFASSLSLSHFLHSWYVNKDPVYKGRSGLGLSFFHQKSVSYKIGYYITPVLFSTIFSIVLLTLFKIPSLKTITLEIFLWKYGIWLLLEMIVIYILCDVVNPSGSKLIQNALTIFIGFIILRSSTSDATLEGVLTNWQNSWPIYAAPIGWGIYWITVFQRDRLTHDKRKGKDESERQLMGVYRVPVIYYFGPVFWSIFVGFFISVVSYYLSHHY
jgi:hypothetical protein